MVCIAAAKSAALVTTLVIERRQRRRHVEVLALPPLTLRENWTSADPPGRCRRIINRRDRVAVLSERTDLLARGPCSCCVATNSTAITGLVASVGTAGGGAASSRSS